MDKIQKFNSVQGSFDTGVGASKVFCDFNIPSGAVLNMKDSYINVCMSIAHTDYNETAGGSNSGGRGVQILDLGLLDSNLGNSVQDLPNVALVKNAHMKGSNVGKIDDVRRLDALKTGFYLFEKDNNDKSDKSYYGLRGIKEQEGFRNSPFQHLERVGTDISVDRTQNVKIKMSEIFDICNETQLDTNKTGNLDIHLELNLDKLRVSQELNATDDIWTETPPRQTDNRNTFQDQTGATGGQVGLTLEMKNIFTPKEFKSQIPYHIGQKLSITAAGGTGGALTAQERRITEIAYDNTTGKTTLTLDSALRTLANGETNSGIVAVGTNVQTNNIVVEKIELVLREVVNPSNVPTSYSYFTYPLEQDNISGSSMRKNYYVEGDSQNAYLMVGDITPSFNTTETLNKYRFSLNNEDLTNRDIQYESSEHNDYVVRTYKNNQRQLKNITKKYIDGTEDINDAGNNYTAYVLMTPLIQRDDNQQSILSINADTENGNAIGDIKIFQERVKTI